MNSETKVILPVDVTNPSPSHGFIMSYVIAFVISELLGKITCIEIHRSNICDDYYSMYTYSDNVFQYIIGKYKLIIRNCQVPPFAVACGL